MIKLNHPSGLLTEKVIHIARPDGSQAIAQIFEGPEDACLALHSLCHEFGTSMFGRCDKSKFRVVVFSPTETPATTIERDPNALTAKSGRVAVSI